VREGRQRHGLRRYLTRQAALQINRAFFAVSTRRVVERLRRLGLDRGHVVCVHAALSRLGYVDGGPRTIVDGLEETVGSAGTILMPSFPTGGSMASYVDSGAVTDIRHSPSKVGALTEAFRQRPGVLRSNHPTNPMAAWGHDAARWVDGHARSETPYGHDTPYGRLARHGDGAFILMMETHVHSFLHHLQERVAFPNLFLPDRRDVHFIDSSGRERTMVTRVMRARIPYFIAIPGPASATPDWVILHDFALMFPRSRERDVRQLGYRFEHYPSLWQRRDALRRAGVLVTGRLGRGDIGLVKVREFLEIVEPELRELLARFAAHYDVEAIARRNLRYS